MLLTARAPEGTDDGHRRPRAALHPQPATRNTKNMISSVMRRLIASPVPFVSNDDVVRMGRRVPSPGGHGLGTRGLAASAPHGAGGAGRQRRGIRLRRAVRERLGVLDRVPGVVRGEAHVQVGGPAVGLVGPNRVDGAGRLASELLTDRHKAHPFPTSKIC